MFYRFLTNFYHLLIIRQNTGHAAYAEVKGHTQLTIIELRNFSHWRLIDGEKLYPPQQVKGLYWFMICKKETKTIRLHPRRWQQIQSRVRASNNTIYMLV
jgi:hypothetical protein